MTAPTDPQPKPLAEAREAPATPTTGQKIAAAYFHQFPAYSAAPATLAEMIDEARSASASPAPETDALRDALGLAEKALGAYSMLGDKIAAEALAAIAALHTPSPKEGETHDGKGPRTTKGPIDVREYVARLDAPSPTPAPATGERDKWHRGWTGNTRINFNGDAWIKVWQDGEWVIVHTRAGGTETTISLRRDQAFGIADALTPELQARFQRARTAEHALWVFNNINADPAELRYFADEIDCGNDCENGWTVECLERGHCKHGMAEDVREFAAAIERKSEVRPAAVRVTGESYAKAIEACGGLEQPAFEAWARSQRYEMSEHPLHYIFLDAKTGDARMGWNAALAYARKALAVSFPIQQDAK